MNTKMRLTLAVVALAVVAPGCSAPEVAATVNGTDIYDSAVLGLRTAESRGPLLAGDQFRDDLTRLIFTEAMLSAAEEDFGITGLASSVAHEAFIATFDEGELRSLASIAQDPELSQSAVDVAVTQRLLRSRVREALAATEENVKEIWENSQDRLVRVCVRHIAVATEAEGHEVHQRIAAGEDFAAVALERSLDTISPGGILPCPSPLSYFDGQFAAGLVAAPVGELGPPIQSGFGWHVVIVDSLTAPESLEELTSDPIGWIPDDLLDGFWGRWLNDAVARADISLRSQIGTWFPPGNGILPPPSSP